eukprot:gene14534-16683_t
MKDTIRLKVPNLGYIHLECLQKNEELTTKNLEGMWLLSRNDQKKVRQVIEQQSQASDPVVERKGKAGSAELFLPLLRDVLDAGANATNTMSEKGPEAAHAVLMQDLEEILKAQHLKTPLNPQSASTQSRSILCELLRAENQRKRELLSIGRHISQPLSSTDIFSTPMEAAKSPHSTEGMRLGRSYNTSATVQSNLLSAMSMGSRQPSEGAALGLSSLFDSSSYNTPLRDNTPSVPTASLPGPSVYPPAGENPDDYLYFSSESHS